MNSYQAKQIEIKINKSLFTNNYDETNQLIQLHQASIRNSAIANTNDKMSACCYWSVVLGVSSSIVGATIWCLIHYYA